nr:protein kinase-like domain-containing protein [Tanacetum cinerariifolium]
NDLSGKIPQFFDKWFSLEFLNLSLNDFEGEVPVVGVFANASAFLVLGNNKLCGGLVILELPKCKETGSKKNGFLSCRPSQSLGNERFLKVSYNQLLKATDGFSTENLIGEGGFSSVYKGILHEDKFVAVKVLHLQKRGADKSFLEECEAWPNIRHPLVYEYMPNGSVHDWLHSNVNTSKLNLLQRINILRDVATALDYLHNRCQTTIVHDDLKPSNILLDAEMVTHVGDFGLARLLCTDVNQNSSRGLKEQLVMHLLVMTGKKPIDGMFNEGLSLPKFAYMALPDHVIDVVDDDAIVLQSTKMNAKKVEECWAATIKIGVSCSVDSPPERMKIEIVVSELQRILDVLQNI